MLVINKNLFILNKFSLACLNKKKGFLGYNKGLTLLLYYFSFIFLLFFSILFFTQLAVPLALPIEG